MRANHISSLLTTEWKRVSSLLNEIWFHHLYLSWNEKEQKREKAAAATRNHSESSTRKKRRSEPPSLRYLATEILFKGYCIIFLMRFSLTIISFVVPHSHSLFHFYTFFCSLLLILYMMLCSCSPPTLLLVHPYGRLEKIIIFLFWERIYTHRTEERRAVAFVDINIEQGATGWVVEWCLVCLKYQLLPLTHFMWVYRLKRIVFCTQFAQVGELERHCCLEGCDVNSDLLSFFLLPS